MLSRKLLTAISSCLLTAGILQTAAHADVEREQLTLSSSEANIQSVSQRYIVELRDPAAAGRDVVIPTSRNNVIRDEKYNASSADSKAYRLQIANDRRRVMISTGITEVTHEYEHTFNGFAAALTDSQVNRLRTDPRVKNVWPDELFQLDTANTPTFLELDAPDGLNTNGILGEDVIVGIIDSGIWPENASFDDTGYGPAPERWNGACETGTDPDFACNNKLIGARYYDDTFGSVFTILPEEFDSPRDADGHGSHVAGTAAGNADVTAVIDGIEVGTISGIAPRARIAAYKVCWNGRVAEETGCFGSDIMAAVDDAVADGVDVINMSISGSETNILTPQLVAFFNATNAGVFSTISAGNRGPGAGTVGNPAPWITSTGASTYDGVLELPSPIVAVTEGTPEVVGQEYVGIAASAAPGLPEGGLSGAIGVAEPLLACEPLTNDLTGQIALISRGACAFTDKFNNAIAAGADAIIVYTDDRPPVTMSSDPINIPAIMIENADGVALVDSATSATTSVDLVIGVGESVQVGNVMANFSSRGANRATEDIIKPDITAPGVNILAAETGFDIDSGVSGLTHQVISGTSMSSPHIAGIAALIKEVHPEWTPDMVKSAMMTTARQNMVKEDGVTPTDAFDYGAGHVVPNASVNPGLVYKTFRLDYFAFLCGIGQVAFVEQNIDEETVPGACDILEDNGFFTDPSDLNMPSIGIADLPGTQVVTRFVDSVLDTESTYEAVVEAPAGVDVEVSVLNTSTGLFEPSTSMTVTAGGFSAYQLAFTPNADAVFDEWVFGAITWTDGVHDVRSPIAIRPVQAAAIDAPAVVSLEVPRSRARVNIPVEINFNGRIAAEAVGMQQASLFGSTVSQDPDQTFGFNEPGLGFFFYRIPEGTRAAKLEIKSEDYPEGVDLDMYVYACPGFSCTLLGDQPTTAIEGSDETYLFQGNPTSLNGPTDAYVVFIHGFDLNGAESVLSILHQWTVDANEGNMSVRIPSVAREGRTSRAYVSARDLVEGQDYVGAVVFTDQDGQEIGVTVIEMDR